MNCQSRNAKKKWVQGTLDDLVRRKEAQDRHKGHDSHQKAMKAKTKKVYAQKVEVIDPNETSYDRDIRRLKTLHAKVETTKRAWNNSSESNHVKHRQAYDSAARLYRAALDEFHQNHDAVPEWEQPGGFTDYISSRLSWPDAFISNSTTVTMR